MEKPDDEKSTAFVRARWSNFHFSGKVIMCSVLFGFGLLLIGGLLLVIDSGDHEKNTNDVSNDMQEVKAPMSFVGPVIMGIGGFTIVIGTIMCLIETKVLRRRNDDSSPLITPRIEEDPETTLSQPRGIQPPAIKKKHNHRKKSPSPGRSKEFPHKVSLGKQKRNPKTSPTVVSEANSISPLPTNDVFLTPANSVATNSSDILFDKKAEGKTGDQSLMKSFANSLDTSYTVSGEFQTPSSSYDSNAMKVDDMRFYRRKSSASITNIYESSSETIFSSEEFATPIASPSILDRITVSQSSIYSTGNAPNAISKEHVNRNDEQMKSFDNLVPQNETEGVNSSAISPQQNNVAELKTAIISSENNDVKQLNAPSLLSLGSGAEQLNHETPLIKEDYATPSNNVVTSTFSNNVQLDTVAIPLQQNVEGINTDAQPLQLNDATQLYTVSTSLQIKNTKQSEIAFSPLQVNDVKQKETVVTSSQVNDIKQSETVVSQLKVNDSKQAETLATSLEPIDMKVYQNGITIVEKSKPDEEEFIATTENLTQGVSSNQKEYEDTQANNNVHEPLVIEDNAENKCVDMEYTMTSSEISEQNSAEYSSKRKKSDSFPDPETKTEYNTTESSSEICGVENIDKTTTEPLSDQNRIESEEENGDSKNTLIF